MSDKEQLEDVIDYTVPVQAHTTKRKSRAWRPDLLALKHFVAAMERESIDTRRAALRYLIDRWRHEL